MVVDGRLIVADAWHHRILVWNAVPQAHDTLPDYAIGQSNLFDTQPNRGRAASLSTLYWPYGLGMFGKQFLVTDTGNRRVLVWNEVPDGDRPADFVIGQPDAHSVDENRGGAVSNQSFRWAHDVASSGDQLFIADAGNHRVMMWQGQVDSDRPADALLGQDCFTAAIESPYIAQGPSRLRFPYALQLIKICWRWRILPTIVYCCFECRSSQDAGNRPSMSSANMDSPMPVRIVGPPLSAIRCAGRMAWPFMKACWRSQIQAITAWLCGIAER